MLDEQDADSFGAQQADDARQPLRQGRADARRGLVEQDERRGEPEHLGQLDELALPVAERRPG